ncbi:integrase catalytic domain-containing protein [Trichonephila clavipes]|nr:integrase catalytic domain-containing protein [Trichonephila clavipes]
MYKNALKEDLIRVVEDLDGTVESTDTIAKLKTKIKKSSTFESDADFVKTLIQNCIDERVSRNEREATLEKQKIELAKLQLAQLEKEVELQAAKNKALSLNPAAKVEEKQFETNIENMIKSIKTLSLPVPTRSENFNLFFQSLERAFLTKKINDEYKSEILINLLGERAHNVLLYIKKEELNDYEKLKSIVLREFQSTPRECLNSFKNAVKSSGETYIQFAARLTANFQYIIETATHIGIREAEDWFRPIDLAKECDIYISSRSGSRKETPIACGYTEDPFKNRPRNYKPKIKDSYPQNLERQNKNCYICDDSSHYARDSKPLSDLLRDNAVFHFGPEQQLAFQTLRQKLSENPVLHIFKQGAKLELHTDASKFGYDKGTAFTSKEFREYCENKNIQHLSITTGIPRGNGQIERIHSSLIPILSKLSIDDASKWYKFVPDVQRTLNSTISRSTHMTPFQLLTGIKMRTKQDLEILKLLEEEIVETFTDNREKIREEAKRNILKMQEENCRNFNKKRKKAYQYEIGDIVAIQRTQFGTGLKLRPKFFFWSL